MSASANGGSAAGEGATRDAATPGRARLAILGSRVIANNHTSRATRRALAIAAEPELLAAERAKPAAFAGREAAQGVWLRPVFGAGAPLLAATRLFPHDGMPATVTTAAAFAEIRSGAQLLALIAMLDDRAVTQPEAWVAGARPEPVEASADPDGADALAAFAERGWPAPAASAARGVSLLAAIRAADARPAVLSGWPRADFWAGVAALYEHLPDAWRAYFSAASGFAEPPSSVLVAARPSAESLADETLGGDPASLRRLVSVVAPPPPPRGLGRDSLGLGAASDVLRRRLRRDDPDRRRAAAPIEAFLTDFDAPLPPPAAKPRAAAFRLETTVDALAEHPFADGGLPGFGLARAVGIVAFDVSDGSADAWLALRKSQPSAIGWAALRSRRFAEGGPAQGCDAIDGLEGLAALLETEAALRPALEKDARTPFDTQAFAERLDALRRRAGDALLLAPHALIERDAEGRSRPAAWLDAGADVFAALDFNEKNRFADRLDILESAASLDETGGDRAAFRAAIKRLRERSGIAAEKVNDAHLGRSLIDAYARSVVAAATPAAVFWREAFDRWLDDTKRKTEVDPSDLLKRIGEKIGRGPGSNAAKRALSVAALRARSMPSAAPASAPTEPAPPPAAPLEDDTAAPVEPPRAALAEPPRATLAQPPSAAPLAPPSAAPLARSDRTPPAPPETAPEPKLARAPGLEDVEADPAAPRLKRLGPSSLRDASPLKADLDRFGAERASEREVIRRRDPTHLDEEDAIAVVDRWQRSFRAELERRIADGVPRAWSLLEASGSAAETAAQVKRLAIAAERVDKRAETRLPAEILWAARQFGDLALDPRQRPRPAPAPLAIRSAWGALADARAQDEPEFAALFALAAAADWLSLSLTERRGAPLVRLFATALAGRSLAETPLVEGRSASVSPQALQAYLYDPGEGGVAALDRTALFARLDRLMFFLSLLDWRASLDRDERLRRVTRLWRPVAVADLLGAESDEERARRRDEAFELIDAPEALVDRLGEELRGRSDEDVRIAAAYCAIAERTGLPGLGQLGRLARMLRRDVLPPR